MPSILPKLPSKIGAYDIVRTIATGGMGQVLLAYDHGLDRHVAIKRLRPDARISRTRRQRFRREARMAAGLDHPAIVRVYDLLEEDGMECIVMEYVEGFTLRQLLKRGPIPVRYVLDIAAGLADGLSLAHQHGVVHRDLKSDNILVTPSGQPKITDFGVAKQLLTDEGSLTKSAVLLGTCRAMAPEQALAQEIDHRADLFAFGVLIYEMLTSVSPFEDKNDLVTLQRITSKPHPPLRSLCPKAPRTLSRLVDDLLAKDRDDRPANAEAVIERLVPMLTRHGSATSSGTLKLSDIREKLKELSRLITG